jgi:hypothetical protein
VLVGLLFESLAIWGILRSVGVGATAEASARRRLHQAKRRLLKWWPWAEPPAPKYITLPVAEEKDTAVGARGLVERKTDRPSPQTFEEVGERPNAIAEHLNAHEREIGAEADRVEGSIRKDLGKLKAEWGERHAEIRQAAAEETKQRIAERKTEGFLFAVGVGLQLAGAALHGRPSFALLSSSARPRWALGFGPGYPGRRGGVSRDSWACHYIFRSSTDNSSLNASHLQPGCYGPFEGLRPPWVGGRKPQARQGVSQDAQANEVPATEQRNCGRLPCSLCRARQRRLRRRRAPRQAEQGSQELRQQVLKAVLHEVRQAVL